MNRTAPSFHTNFDSDSPQKIMVRAPNWVGDTVISLPALKALRGRFPKSELIVVATPWVADVYRTQRWITDVVLFDRSGKHKGPFGFRRFLHRLRQEEFDLAVLFQNAFQAAWMARRARIPVRIGYATDGRGFLLTNPLPVPPRSAFGHQAYYYLHLLWRAGLIREIEQPPSPHLVLPSRTLKLSELRLRTQGINREKPGERVQPVVGIHPGASFGSAKRWLAERFAALADRCAQELNAKIVLFGSPNETLLAESVLKAMQTEPVNLAGRTALLDLMAALKSCRTFVCNDSGPMHLAAALDVPVVAIFGSTDERVTGPLGRRSRVVKNPVECSPCLLRECPIDFRCMEGLTVDQVFEQVREQVSAAPPAEEPVPASAEKSP